MSRAFTLLLILLVNAASLQIAEADESPSPVSNLNIIIVGENHFGSKKIKNELIEKAAQNEIYLGFETNLISTKECAKNNAEFHNISCDLEMPLIRAVSFLLDITTGMLRLHYLYLNKVINADKDVSKQENDSRIDFIAEKLSLAFKEPRLNIIWTTNREELLRQDKSKIEDSYVNLIASQIDTIVALAANNTETSRQEAIKSLFNTTNPDVIEYLYGIFQRWLDEALNMLDEESGKTDKYLGELMLEATNTVRAEIMGDINTWSKLGPEYSSLKILRDVSMAYNIYQVVLSAAKRQKVFVAYVGTGHILGIARDLNFLDRHYKPNQSNDIKKLSNNCRVKDLGLETEINPELIINGVVIREHFCLSVADTSGNMADDAEIRLALESISTDTGTENSPN